MSLDSVKDLKIVEDHTAILEAIRNKQLEQARTLMEIHLARYKVDAITIREKYPEFF